jgi:predicted nucleic acid-binding protein
VIQVALDTNVLAYAEGTNGKEKKRAALDLVSALAPDSTLIPAQALCELYHVLVRKAGRSRDDADRAVQAWGDVFPIVDTSAAVVATATTLSSHHQLGLWDSIILAAAADARCRLLLSEDLQDGFSWSGVTVVNPFRSERHPLLAAALS